MKSKDVYIGISLMVISVLAIFGSYHFSKTITWGYSLTANTDVPYRASAGTFPRLVSVILFVLSAVMAVKGQVANKTKRFSSEEACSTKKIEIKKSGILFIFSLIAYFVLLQPLGFAIATILFSIACSFVFDTGKFSRLKTCTTAVLFSCTVIFLFYRLLYLPLPRGAGIFRTISELIIFVKL